MLSTLLLLKSRYRLPIDVIALRTGAYDDTQPVDLSKETARFQDLEALVRRAARGAAVVAGRRRHESLRRARSQAANCPAAGPKLPLLKTYAPNYRYPANRRRLVRKVSAPFQAMPYIDVDQNADRPQRGADRSTACCSPARAGLPSENFAHAVSIYYFSKLAEILPGRWTRWLMRISKTSIRTCWGWSAFSVREAIGDVSADLQTFMPQEELIDHFDEVLFNCKLHPIKAVHDEYVRRIGELKKKQFLSDFPTAPSGHPAQGGRAARGHVHHRLPRRTRAASGYDRHDPDQHGRYGRYLHHR